MQKVYFRDDEGDIREVEPLEMTPHEIELWFTQETGKSFDKAKLHIYQTFHFRPWEKGHPHIVSSTTVAEPTEKFFEWWMEQGGVSREELIGCLVEVVERIKAARKKSLNGRTSSLDAKILDAFRTLGVEPSTPLDEIRRRYRELVKQTHPDLNPEKVDAKEEFIKITEAYKMVTNDDHKGIVSDVVDESKKEEWVQVFCCNVVDSHKAIRAEEKLKSEGIEYEKKIVKLSPVAREIRIFVKREDKEKADEMINPRKKLSIFKRLFG